MTDIFDLPEIYKNNFYPGAEKLHKLALEKYPTIKRKDVNTFLKNQAEVQVVTQTKERKNQGHMIALLPNEIWEMDIYVMDRYEKQNDGYSYILAVVDVFTRKAFAEPMKKKDINTVCKTFLKIIVDAAATPRSIISDSDSSFTGDEFLDLCEKHKIALQTVVVNDHKALGIIDNFARRVKTTLTKLFLFTKSTNWIEYLPTLMKLYNATAHSSLDDLTPNQASEDGNFSNILEINLSKAQANEKFIDLKDGNKVRVDIQTKFTKGTDQKYSDEVYTVKNVNGNKITLDNGKTFKRSSVIKVPDDAESTEIFKPGKEAKVQKKVKQVLKKEGLKESDKIQSHQEDVPVKRSSRERKQTKNNDFIYL